MSETLKEQWLRLSGLLEEDYQSIPHSTKDTAGESPQHGIAYGGDRGEHKGKGKMGILNPLARATGGGDAQVAIWDMVTTNLSSLGGNEDFEPSQVSTADVSSHAPDVGISSNLFDWLSSDITVEVKADSGTFDSKSSAEFIKKLEHEHYIAVTTGAMDGAVVVKTSNHGNKVNTESEVFKKWQEENNGSADDFIDYMLFGTSIPYVSREAIAKELGEPSRRTKDGKKSGRAEIAITAAQMRKLGAQAARTQNLPEDSASVTTNFPDAQTIKQLMIDKRLGATVGKNKKPGSLSRAVDYLLTRIGRFTRNPRNPDHVLNTATATRDHIVALIKATDAQGNSAYGTYQDSSGIWRALFPASPAEKGKPTGDYVKVAQEILDPKEADTFIKLHAMVDSSSKKSGKAKRTKQQDGIYDNLKSIVNERRVELGREKAERYKKVWDGIIAHFPDACLNYLEIVGQTGRAADDENWNFESMSELPIEFFLEVPEDYLRYLPSDHPQMIEILNNRERELDQSKGDMNGEQFTQRSGSNTQRRDSYEYSPSDDDERAMKNDSFHRGGPVLSEMNFPTDVDNIFQELEDEDIEAAEEGDGVLPPLEESFERYGKYSLRRYFL